MPTPVLQRSSCYQPGLDTLLGFLRPRARTCLQCIKSFLVANTRLLCFLDVPRKVVADVPVNGLTPPRERSALIMALASVWSDSDQ
jgi:hypothetical protein